MKKWSEHLSVRMCHSRLLPNTFIFMSPVYQADSSIMFTGQTNTGPCKDSVKEDQATVCLMTCWFTQNKLGDDHDDGAKYKNMKGEWRNNRLSALIIFISSFI